MGNTIWLEAQHITQIIIAWRLIVVAAREGAHWRRILEIGKRQAGEGAVRARSGVEPIEELGPHRDVQRAVDIVVRAVGPDLVAGIEEIVALQLVDDGRRPASHLIIVGVVQQLRRPPAPSQ